MRFGLPRKVSLKAMENAQSLGLPNLIRFLGWRLFLLPLLLLTSCGTLTSVTQPHIDPEMDWTLSGKHAIGQTFLAHHDGLNGVEVALATTDGAPLPSLAFALRSDPLTPRELVRGLAVDVDRSADGWLRLTFPALADSHGQRFYLEITWSDGIVWVPLGPASAYQDGAAYRDGQAQEAHLVFRLSYDRGTAALGLLKRLATGLPRGVAVLLLFLLPGLALTAWLLPSDSMDTVSRLILSAGLSVALFPLLLLGARVLGGLRVGPLGTWLLLVVCAAAVAWRIRPSLSMRGLRQRIRDAWSWPIVTLGIVTVLVFGVRLLVTSSLAAPMWGDSYEHAVIAQLLVDHGGLFDSWEPYTPYETFTLHPGFHAAVAFFHWISGVEAVPAVTVVGQILNGLAALTLYPLAVRLSGQRWAGVAAVVLAGLLSPMPMFYVNWGRYPQLAGQVVLPVAAWFFCDALETLRGDARRLGLAAIAAAGLFLCYYRIGYFYATFVVAWLLLYGVEHWRRDLRRWLGAVARTAAIAVGAGVLVLPQILALSQGWLGTVISPQAVPPEAWQAVLDSYYRVWRELDFYTPWPLLVLSGAGLGWALWQRRWAVLSVGLWAAMLASLMLTTVLRLPGVGMVTNFAVIIAWYIPVSLLGAWAVGEIACRLERRWPRVGVAVLASTLLAASLWGAIGQMDIVEPDNILVTYPDRAAMDWIAEHIPPDSLFLVNGYAVHKDTSVVGADAGWWIPLLAGPQTTMPPQYALVVERPAEPGYSQRMTELVLDLRATSLVQPHGQRALCQNGITHLYIGQGQGLVGTSGPALIPAADLEASPAFEVLYHQDRVWVFAFDRSLCQD